VWLEKKYMTKLRCEYFCRVTLSAAGDSIIV
jgi:hypothetical protein